MTNYYSNRPIHSKVYCEPLRVGTVARICRVTRKTINNWINHGTLRSFATHGGHHRIWPADLHAFLVRSGMNVEFKFDDTRQPRFLIVNHKARHRNLLLKSFTDRFPRASVFATRNEYEALLLVGERKPHVVTWDLNMPRFDGLRIIEFLQTRRSDASIHVTLCHETDHEELKWCAFTGSTQEGKVGTGLTEMLNSLQTLLVPLVPSSTQANADADGQPYPRIMESEFPCGLQI